MRVAGGARARSAGLYRFLGELMVTRSQHHSAVRASLAESRGVLLGASYTNGVAEAFEAGRPIRVPAWMFNGHSMREAGIRNPLPKDRLQRARTYLVSPDDSVQPIEGDR